MYSSIAAPRQTAAKGTVLTALVKLGVLGVAATMLGLAWFGHPSTSSTPALLPVAHPKGSRSLQFKQCQALEARDGGDAAFSTVQQSLKQGDAPLIEVACLITEIDMIKKGLDGWARTCGVAGPKTSASIALARKQLLDPANPQSTLAQAKKAQKELEEFSARGSVMRVVMRVWRGKPSLDALYESIFEFKICFWGKGGVAPSAATEFFWKEGDWDALKPEVKHLVKSWSLSAEVDVLDEDLVTLQSAKAALTLKRQEDDFFDKRKKDLRAGFATRIEPLLDVGDLVGEYKATVDAAFALVGAFGARLRWFTVRGAFTLVGFSHDKAIITQDAKIGIERERKRIRTVQRAVDTFQGNLIVRRDQVRRALTLEIGRKESPAGSSEWEGQHIEKAKTAKTKNGVVLTDAERERLEQIEKQRKALQEDSGKIYDQLSKVQLKALQHHEEQVADAEAWLVTAQMKSVSEEDRKKVAVDIAGFERALRNFETNEMANFIAAEVPGLRYELKLKRHYKEMARGFVELDEKFQKVAAQAQDYMELAARELNDETWKKNKDIAHLAVGYGKMNDVEKATRRHFKTQPRESGVTYHSG